MVLVDTSIWIDHFKKGDSLLIELLEENAVFIHPFVIGELACGNITNRDEILKLLNVLPKITTVGLDEILFFIDQHKLFGKGIGYIDVNIIASCLIENVTLYTRDKPLSQVANDFGILYYR